MRKAISTLLSSDDQGSVSRVETDSGLSLLFLELPDRQNRRNRSRIPAGEYLLEWAESPAHGWCYHFRNVAGHDHVLVHIGNLAGDVELGYVSDSEACFLPGASRALFLAGEKVGHHVLSKDQHGVASSGVALKALVDEMHQEPFMLTVRR